MWGAVLFFVFVCAGEAIAGGSGNHRRVGLRRAVPDHVVAYAALESPERGAGWGRFVVRDAALPSREERALQVSVFGLDPGARYLVEADGIEVGAIVTDRKGDGSLKLETTGRGLHDVLSGLPPADDMVGAGIRDTWGAVILDGYFRVVRAHISDPTVHSEKIHLEDETEGDARGMAAVCRKESGAQGFATMAAGLEPGLLYTIVVDTIEVGIVTADEEGQGGLELRVPAEEDLLPDALQPVDEIRHVQWFQGELLLLSGVFSGESDTDDRCHEVEGRFAGLTDDGFILRKGDADLEVVVTSETEFGGFDNLAQLEEGDWLEVRGCWDDEHFVAESVGFEEPEPECDTFLGEILERIDGGFVLQVGDEAIEVHVTEETIFSGFEDLEDLDEGDIVKIRGCFVAEVIAAVWAGLLEDDDCIELRGLVAERTDRGFLLQVGEDFIEVVVTDETRLKNFESLGELDGGEKVALEGCFDGDVLVAAWVSNERITGSCCRSARTSSRSSSPTKHGSRASRASTSSTAARLSCSKVVSTATCWWLCGSASSRTTTVSSCTASWPNERISGSCCRWVTISWTLRSQTRQCSRTSKASNSSTVARRSLLKVASTARCWWPHGSGSSRTTTSSNGGSPTARSSGCWRTDSPLKLTARK
jgi:hypothetical protein